DRGESVRARAVTVSTASAAGAGMCRLPHGARGALPHAGRLDTVVEQQGRDRLRILTHRVVGGGELVDVPVGIGLEAGAQVRERRLVLPARAVDELPA